MPANKWLKVYAARIRHRLKGEIPSLAPELSDQDILAMQMVSVPLSLETVRL